MPKKLYINCKKIEKTAKKLVKKLRKYNFDKDKTLVVGVGRGGLIASQYVAYGLGIRNMTIIQSKSYEGENKSNNQMEVSGALMLDYDSYDHILLVDDLIDSGNTMEVLLELMEDLIFEFESKVAVVPCVLFTQKSKKDVENMGAIFGKSFYKKGKPSKWLMFPWNTFIDGCDM